MHAVFCLKLIFLMSLLRQIVQLLDVADVLELAGHGCLCSKKRTHDRVVGK